MCVNKQNHAMIIPLILNLRTLVLNISKIEGVVPGSVDGLLETPVASTCSCIAVLGGATYSIIHCFRGGIQPIDLWYAFSRA